MSLSVARVMAAALNMADWRWIMLAIVAAGVCEFFGILRWQLFLRMLHIEVPLRKTSNLFFIGAFFNQFLPGTTGGDVVRVIFLMQDHPENKTEGFLSVAVDRLLAVLVLVIMGLLFAWLRTDWFASSFAVGHLMKWFAITLFVMALALVASFVLTSRHLVTLLPRRFPFRRQIIKLSRIWQLCLENRREALLGTIYTVPMLLAYFSAFCFAAKAFTDKVSFWDMTSIMPLVTAISSLPISLNGIGVREALFEELLAQLCGVSRGTGLLISISRNDRLSTLGFGRRVLLSWTHHQALSRFQGDGREINRRRLDAPPKPRPSPLGHGGKGIAVAERPDEAWRIVRKGIFLEQIGDGRRTLE